MSWRLNDKEAEALLHMPHRAIVLYTLELRRYMDYETAIVGGPKRRINLKGLAEAIEVRPGRRSTEKPYSPTIDGVRAVLAMLERAGLIERIKQPGKFNYLVLKLVLADTGKNRLNEEPHHNPMMASPPTAQSEAQVVSGSTHNVTPLRAPREKSENQLKSPIHPSTQTGPHPE